jgi:hypothetical protein
MYVIPRLVSLLARDVGIFVNTASTTTRDPAADTLTAELSRLSLNTPTLTPSRALGLAGDRDPRRLNPSPSTPLRTTVCYSWLVGGLFF